MADYTLTSVSILRLGLAIVFDCGKGCCSGVGSSSRTLEYDRGEQQDGFRRGTGAGCCQRADRIRKSVGRRSSKERGRNSIAKGIRRVRLSNDGN